MFDYTKPLPEAFRHEGKIYKVNMSYDIVLRALELYKEHSDDVGKTAALKLLSASEPIPIALFDAIITTLFSVMPNRGNGDEPPVMDFMEDAPFIYASFMSDYGIDLIEERGKLHWYKFVALSSGLTEHTKMREIIAIRTRPIPAANKYNAKERETLTKLKAAYALKSGAFGMDMQSGLAQLGGIMRGMAEKE